MCKKIITILVIVFLTASVAQSQALMYLRINNSPRANGMGSATINLVDAQSALYNPGAYGLFCMDHNFSFSIPSSTNWLPALADDINLKTWSVGGGYSPNRFQKTENGPAFSFGIAYSKNTIDYGTVVSTDEGGNAIDITEPYDKTSYYTIGVGIDHHIKIGIGFTLKKFTSDLSGFGHGIEIGIGKASGSAYDFGVLFEFPMHRLLDMQTPQSNEVGFEITPSLAYVVANVGDPVAYIDAAQADPLPKMRRLGFGLYTNIFQNSKSIISAQLVFEMEKNLVNDLVEYNRKGLEIGFYNSVFVRLGSINDKVSNESALSTIGFGVSLQGIMSSLSLIDTIESPNSTTDYILQNFDITFDYAKWDDGNHLLSNTKFVKINLSL